MFGREDVIPLWVADTDFAAPQAVTDALVARARHPAYGYTLFPDSLYESMIDWFREHHDWTIQREWVRMAPGWCRPCMRPPWRLRRQARES